MLISKVIVTNPPSSEVKVKTCKLFHFLFKRRKDLFTKFLCKYIKFKFTAMLPDESDVGRFAYKSFRLHDLGLFAYIEVVSHTVRINDIKVDSYTQFELIRIQKGRFAYPI